MHECAMAMAQSSPSGGFTLLLKGWKCVELVVTAKTESTRDNASPKF